MTLKAVARIGDHGTGTCPIDGFVTITFTTGDSLVTADGIGIVRIGDHGIASCGHTVTARTGSLNSKLSNLLGVHRVGDTGDFDIGGGTYTCTDGSPNVFSE